MIAAKVKLLMVLPFWHRSYYFAIAQRATVWQSCSLDWSLGWSEGERITPSVKLEASLLYIWEPATSKHYPAVQHSTIQHHPTIYFQHPANWHWFPFSCPRVATHTTSQIADWFKIPTFIFWSSFSLVFFLIFSYSFLISLPWPSWKSPPGAVQPRVTFKYDFCLSFVKTDAGKIVCSKCLWQNWVTQAQVWERCRQNR